MKAKIRTTMIKKAISANGFINQNIKASIIVVLL
jgi:hypothetical protein